MLTREEIDQAQAYPVTAYLAGIGCQPVRTDAGGQHVYRSPLTGEQTPSFFVHPAKNVFSDFSSGESGNVIRLVRLVRRCGFPEAVAHLRQLAGGTDKLDGADAVAFSFSDFSQPSGITVQAGITVRKVKALENRALIGYLNGRGISHARACGFVREAYFQMGRGNAERFALAFGNDGGGYELRAAWPGFDFKSVAGCKAITTIPSGTGHGYGTGCLNVFEGFFDFLAALEHFGTYHPAHTTIILNSLANLPKLEGVASRYGSVNAFLDNDDAGRRGLANLKLLHPNVQDRSRIYGGHKDFNEYLCAAQRKALTRQDTKNP